MEARFSRPVEINHQDLESGKTYKEFFGKGIHKVPDALSHNWFFKALVKSGEIMITEQPSLIEKVFGGKDEKSPAVETSIAAKESGQEAAEKALADEKKSSFASDKASENVKAQVVAEPVKGPVSSNAPRGRG